MKQLRMPNLRRMFVPDPDFTLFEVDLKGADARVVAWEADDVPLKDAFRQGLDIHAFNAETIWRKGAALSEYSTHKELKPLRQKAKTACHAVNYGCKARTLADHINTTTNEAEEFIDGWFRLHPGIREWHRRIDNQLVTARKVSNIWGYQRRYFDRTDNLLPEALAWIGQSTTAIAINRLIVHLHQSIPEVHNNILLQTHDSVTFQIPTATVVRLTPIVRRLCQVEVPYADLLVMPCDISTSTTSWGELTPL